MSQALVWTWESKSSLQAILLSFFPSQLSEHISKEKIMNHKIKRDAVIIILVLVLINVLKSVRKFANPFLPWFVFFCF